MQSFWPRHRHDEVENENAVSTLTVQANERVADRYHQNWKRALHDGILIRQNMRN